MTDTQKIEELKKILSGPISWYEDKMSLQKSGDIDDSYIYDELWTVFDDMSRGQFLEIIETILK